MRSRCDNELRVNAVADYIANYCASQSQAGSLIEK